MSHSSAPHGGESVGSDSDNVHVTFQTGMNWQCLVINSLKQGSELAPASSRMLVKYARGRFFLHPPACWVAGKIWTLTSHLSSGQKKWTFHSGVTSYPTVIRSRSEQWPRLCLLCEIRSSRLHFCIRNVWVLLFTLIVFFIKCTQKTRSACLTRHVTLLNPTSSMQVRSER